MSYVPSLFKGADLRTNGAKRVRIANRLSTLLQGNMCETLRAWSKFKTGCHEVTCEGESQIAQLVRDDRYRHPELVSGSKTRDAETSSA